MRYNGGIELFLENDTWKWDEKIKITLNCSWHLSQNKKKYSFAQKNKILQFGKINQIITPNW